MDNIHDMGNIQWLIENGGAAIKLNLMNEGLIDKNTFNSEKLVDELMQIEKVKTVFTYFDVYKNYNTITLRKLANDIHNCYEECYERFMPLLINLGFRSGIFALDEKIDIMRQVYRYIIKSNGGGGEIIVTFMLKAGYYDDDMLFYLNRMLDKLYNTAKKQCFDIYETDPAKIRWSKLPDIWKKGPIAKDIHVHDVTASELPLPTIYHINYLANMYKHIGDNEIKQKIDAIIKYIMHPEYQKYRGVYGASWFYDKAYYAPSPGISLPLYADKKIGGYKDILGIISSFPTATRTEWFRNCIELLEQYKTVRGTYILLDDYLNKTPAKSSKPSLLYDAYISKDVLPKIKKNERRLFADELFGTLFVLSMKKRMQFKLT